jgi:hypothetical protein
MVWLHLTRWPFHSQRRQALWWPCFARLSCLARFSCLARLSCLAPPARQQQPGRNTPTRRATRGGQMLLPPQPPFAPTCCRCCCCVPFAVCRVRLFLCTSRYRERLRRRWQSNAAAVVTDAAYTTGSCKKTSSKLAQFLLVGGLHPSHAIAATSGSLHVDGDADHTHVVSPDRGRALFVFVGHLLLSSCFVFFLVAGTCCNDGSNRLDWVGNSRRVYLSAVSTKAARRYNAWT